MYHHNHFYVHLNGIKYIHIIVQPSISRTFSFPQTDAPSPLNTPLTSPSPTIYYFLSLSLTPRDLT